MKIEITLMAGLATALLACGDRTERPTDPDASGMQARREIAAEEPYVAAAPDRGAPTASDQSGDPADVELVGAIRRELMADDTLSTSGQNVTIVAQNGAVTLRGSVASADEKSRIETAARQAPGARQVDNQIEVAP